VDLARHACAWGKVDLGPEIPPGMDFALRRKGERTFRFLLNFSETAKSVRLAEQRRDLISGKSFTDHVTVPPLELCVLV